MDSAQLDNEWDFDIADRVSRAVGALDTRDSLSIALHLRWQINALMREVKVAHLTVPELVAMIAILTAAGPDVIGRVANATAHVASTSVAGLRAQIHELMTVVKLGDLSAPELCALLAVLSPANGRRLLAVTLGKTLRPILRVVGDIVDDVADHRDSALQLCE
jgi:hypothetical protein